MKKEPKPNADELKGKNRSPAPAALQTTTPTVLPPLRPFALDDVFARAKGFRDADHEIAVLRRAVERQELTRRQEAMARESPAPTGGQSTEKSKSQKSRAIKIDLNMAGRVRKRRRAGETLKEIAQEEGISVSSLTHNPILKRALKSSEDTPEERDRGYKDKNGKMDAWTPTRHDA